MKKIIVILACVIIAAAGISIPIIHTAANDTVTAEATEEVTESTTETTTEATTETTVEETTVETTVEETTKQESKTTEKSSKSTTETTTEEEIEPETKEEEYIEEGEDVGEFYDGVQLLYSEPYNITSNKLTRRGGVAYYNGHKETWYSQKILPGGGLSIPGRHVADDGTIRDGEGYICVAANPSYLSYHSRIMTSLGPAKVYDSGCDYGTIDVYVNW